MKEGLVEVVRSSMDDSLVASSMGVAAVAVGIKGHLRTDRPIMSLPTMSSWLDLGIALKKEMVSYKLLILLDLT